jgi:hypothetical protein
LAEYLHITLFSNGYAGLKAITLSVLSENA